MFNQNSPNKDAHLTLENYKSLLHKASNFKGRHKIFLANLENFKTGDKFTAYFIFLKSNFTDLSESEILDVLSSRKTLSYMFDILKFKNQENGNANLVKKCKKMHLENEKLKAEIKKFAGDT